MLEDLYSWIDEISTKNKEIAMPEVTNPETTQSKYSIIESERKLIIGNQEYIIPDFFNISNAINKDYKTLDYIFTYWGLNTEELIE